MADTSFLEGLFSLKGKVAIVTGGTGVLGGAMATGLARAGAKVAVLGRRRDAGEQVKAAIEAEGGQALVLTADVLQRDSLLEARDQVLEAWQQIDILVNAAGGNSPAGTVAVDGSFFDLTQAGMQSLIDLNLMGTLLPTQIFGEQIAAQRHGHIVNISSLSVPRALTRTVAYGVAKAGVENFTRWLAVETINKYGQGVHVNAIAPGFFIAEQNRQFMVNEDGSFTARGQSVVDHTPTRRFGEPDELVGALIWLCSPAASFVYGQVITVDGGFGIFSGV